MATSYPGLLDTYQTKATGTPVEAQHINDVQDAIRAIETKLGADTSPAVGSITHLVKTAVDPGHHHTKDYIDSVAEGVIVRPGSPILARLASDELVGGAWTYTQKVTFNGGLLVHGGYGLQAVGQGTRLAIGASGVSPDAGSIAWGDGTGYKLHFATFTPGFTPRVTIVDRGLVGINVQAPVAALQVSDTSTVTDFATATVRGVLTITGPSATNNINAMTFTAADNSVQAKIAAIKKSTGGYEARISASDGTGTNNFVVVDSLGALGFGDQIKARANLIFGLESWTSDATRLGWTQTYLANDNNAPNLRLYKSRGTYASSLPVNALDFLGSINFGGNRVTGSTPLFNIPVSIAAVAEQAFSGTAAGARLSFFTTPLNSLSPVEALRLAADSKIGLGAVTPNAELQFKSTTGRKLVLFENTNSDDDVYGWLISSNLLRHAVPPAARHGFYVGANQMARIDAAGAVFGDTSVAAVASLEVKGTFAIGKTKQITVTSAGQVIANVDVSGVSVIEVLDGTGGAINGLDFFITGFANGVANQVVIIRNTTSGQMKLKHQDAGSTSGNRFFLFQPGDLQCSTNGGGMAVLWKGGTGATPWFPLLSTHKSVQGL